MPGQEIAFCRDTFEKEKAQQTFVLTRLLQEVVREKRQQVTDVLPVGMEFNPIQFVFDLLFSKNDHLELKCNDKGSKLR